MVDILAFCLTQNCRVEKYLFFDLRNSVVSLNYYLGDNMHFITIKPGM